MVEATLSGETCETSTTIANVRVESLPSAAPYVIVIVDFERSDPLSLLVCSLMKTFVRRSSAQLSLLAQLDDCRMTANLANLSDQC